MTTVGTPAIHPGGMPVAEFLADYWQRKALCIPRAWPDFTAPLSAEELAGLACEDGIDARLIIEKDAAQPWHLEHGPFEPQRFSQLPASHWTLLVQSVDHYVPAVTALRDHFHFLPRWRLDDIMISFAAPGGSVGPHCDQYDVFLLQAMGRREWRLGAPAGPDDEYVTDSGLCLLQRFEESARYLLEPGDMLYLPPGVPHHGIALEEGMTISIGFRAPAADEILAAAAEQLATEKDLPRFSDAGRSSTESAGQITSDDVDRLREILVPLCQDTTRLARILGQLTTEVRDEFGVDAQSVETFALLRECDGERRLHRHPASRLAWHQADDGTVLCFFNGCSTSLAPTLLPLVRTLCDHDVYSIAQLGACIESGGDNELAAMDFIDRLLAEQVLRLDGD